ncbi:TonB-dependent receptor [Neiella marina]|uniref:TonB-dependent receptor n=1 Tax=Neiella holothuriorum TaxID=2870530 RepID=A0ABS7ECD2_9GAMM|nr:TonB-dependent receptor [Neiella holothuriorum]MBW8189869.1 TonB-dependent receptor [Neiella holothuriorum]
MTSRTCLLATLAALPTAALSATPDHIEIIGTQDHNQITVELPTGYQQPDPGELVKRLPGANINRNGPLTPIAQYRGLYGDRVAVTIDGVGVIGTGPNSMDSPLSYVPMILLQDIEQHRGVTPVDTAIESLGGAFAVNLRPIPAEIGEQFVTSAEVSLGYQDNGEQYRAAIVVESGNRDHGVQLFYDWQQATDHLESGNGNSIEPTEFDKWVAGAKYQYNLQSGHIQVWGQRFDTGLSGTPALPMDILYIDTDRAGITSQVDWREWQAHMQLSYSDGEHLMDNFTMRNNGELSGRMRQNLANSDDWQWSAKAKRNLNNQTLEFGSNGLRAHHDATITDPTNAMFVITNFNAIDDDKTSFYASWSQAAPEHQLSADVRATYVASDAGEVTHSMAGNSAMIAMLVDNFNNAKRDQDDWLIDTTLAGHWQPAAHWSYSLSLGHKQRAPSYQERYLWFPLEATAGLADGRTYIGDPNLDAERAWQLDIGGRWQSSSLQIEPHLFYQRIDDYIQGTPLPDDGSYAAANMVATMMTGNSPLLFSNVEAELYGGDLLLSWQWHDSWTWTSTASYVRGKRRDIDDNLYRVAPPNWRNQISYQWYDWQVAANWLLVAEQDKISTTNSEQKTAGYGLVDLTLKTELNVGAFHLGVNNVFDKQYADHLGGYNRVMATAQQTGERLSQTGRAIWAKLTIVL